MTLLMVFAVVVSVAQLCLVSVGSRSVRASTVFQAALVGLMVCGPLADKPRRGDGVQQEDR